MTASIIAFPGLYTSNRALSYEPAVLRLPPCPSEGRVTLSVSPSRIYKPFTLLVWGAKANTTFRDIVIGAERQLLNKIPGCLFESEIPFDEFERLLLRRVDGQDAVRDLDQLGHFFRFDMPTVTIGSPIAVEVEGGYDQAVFIGHQPVCHAEPEALS